jgi:hypothetical protein
MTTTTQTAQIFIPAGTIVGYSYRMKKSAPVTGTVTLTADCYIPEARREENGSWSYSLSPDRTYYCAGGLATVIGPAVEEG